MEHIVATPAGVENEQFTVKLFAAPGILEQVKVSGIFMPPEMELSVSIMLPETMPGEVHTWLSWNVQLLPGVTVIPLQLSLEIVHLPKLAAPQAESGVMLLGCRVSAVSTFLMVTIWKAGLPPIMTLPPLIREGVKSGAMGWEIVVVMPGVCALAADAVIEATLLTIPAV